MVVQLIRDQNHVAIAGGASSADSTVVLPLIMDSVTGRVLVDLSGSGVSVETPVGTVNDANTSFTVSNTPIFIVVNGGIYVAGTGIFASYAGGTITLNAPVGTGGFIRSFY